MFDLHGIVRSYNSLNFEAENEIKNSKEFFDILTFPYEKRVSFSELISGSVSW
jgi:hypothetical protein